MPTDALERAAIAWYERDKNRDALIGCPLERAIQSGRWDRELKIHMPTTAYHDEPQEPRCTN